MLCCLYVGCFVVCLWLDCCEQCCWFCFVLFLVGVVRCLLFIVTSELFVRYLCCLVIVLLLVCLVCGWFCLFWLFVLNCCFIACIVVLNILLF